MENEQKFVQCPYCEELSVHDGCINNCDHCPLHLYNDPMWKGWSLMDSIRIGKPRKL